jgi:hypothetical protein
MENIKSVQQQLLTLFSGQDLNAAGQDGQQQQQLMVP